MSTLRCPVVRLGPIEVHDNADALEIVNVLGYQAVVQKGLHREGNLVVYVPEGAVVPADVLEEFGFTGKLAGKDKNRVKAVRLRGKLSQGLVLPAIKVLMFLAIHGRLTDDVHVRRETGGPEGEAELFLREGADLAAALGITKWEPPIPVHMQGEVQAAPEWFRLFYDIENVKSWPEVLTPTEPLIATEKIHGTNMRAGWHREDGFFVASRGRDVALKPNDTNLYWRAARQVNVEQALRALVEQYGLEYAVVFGEVYGARVQDLHYGHADGQISFAAFDLLVCHPDQRVPQFVSYDSPLHASLAVPHVPVVARGTLSEVLTSVSGTAFRGDHMREGLVLRPILERHHPDLGRVVLKAINPDYLLRQGGTEFH